MDQWGQVASDLFGIGHPALSDQPPKQQAEFWLHEVETVEQADHDPLVAMGAAWMLDAPQYGFIRHHVRMKEDLNFPGIPASWRRELDQETISTLCEDFELLCREECLARIETAIRPDETNVELWRARALLLFQTEFMNIDLEPRRDDWLVVLDECLEHDPENALYDYLAALYLWTSSAEYDWGEDGYILSIEDNETFNRGNARFASGLAKPHLKSGTEGYAATLTFLAKTSVAKLDHLTAAGSRQNVGKVNNLLYRIMRWQNVQLDVEKREENFEAAIAALQNVRKISDQVTEAGNYPNLSLPKLVLRQWSLANLEDMYQDYPDLFNAEESAGIPSQLATVQLDLEVLEETGKRLADEAGTSVSTEVSPGTVMTLSKRLLAVFLVAMAQMLVIVTVGMAVVSWLGARLCGASGDDEPVTMGWLRHTTAWLFALGLSFVLLGMFPTEVVPPSIQTWLVCGLIWIVFGLLMLGLLYLIRRRFPLPWSQLTVLLVTMALPLIIALHFSSIIDFVITCAAALNPLVTVFLLLLAALLVGAAVRLLIAFKRTDVLVRRRKYLAVGVIFLVALVAVPAGTALGILLADELETRTWITPTAWEEARGLHIEADELQNAMSLGNSKGTWALIQWQAHHGAIVAPMLAVCVLLVWHTIRLAPA